jgi:SpoVK/Ycf46/Vps4 family AAA+-type ATPase
MSDTIRRAAEVPTTGESIRKMIAAHFKGDDDAFRTAVEEYISEERRKNHHVVARDLERLIGNFSGSQTFTLDSLTLLGVPSANLPQDKERGLTLVEVSEPQRGLDSLILSDSLRDSIKRIITENRLNDVLRSHGMKPIGKALLCGPPGCGKTVAAEVVAKELYLPLVLVRFDAVVSSYLGETAANLRRVFDFARTRPMVLLFDEFDAIGKQRSLTDDHGELKRVVNSFLQMLDAYRGEAIIIAASNFQGLLDPALWRRFDDILYFDKPDAGAIEALLLRYLRQTGMSPSVRLKQIARKLIGMSHADVERVANDAIKVAILENCARIEPRVLETAINRQKARMRVTEGAQPPSKTAAEATTA